MGAMNQGVFWPDAFCEALARAGFYVVRYDHRDTGKSSKIDFQANPYDLNTLAEDAVDIIRSYGLVQPVIVGLSMGGYIAQLLAAAYPTLVKRIVLISSTADHRPYMAATTGQSTAAFSLPGPEQSYLDYVMAASLNPPQTLDAVLQSMSDGWKLSYGGPRPYPKIQVEQALRLALQRSSDMAAGFHHGWAVAASPDRLQLVTRITAATMVIHGRYDPLLPLAHGQYLASHMANAQLEIVEMGHSFMWSWDQEVLAIMLKFMQSR
ncbi:MAG: alpha/beta hydrolase [Comamonadaceae bacterium]|nr:MAG: alpha/beta hydrolase [Comamonadaceae bacterium]